MVLTAWQDIIVKREKGMDQLPGSVERAVETSRIHESQLRGTEKVAW